MAGHVAVARRRREDVEASGAWWRCGRATGALCATSGENAGEDGEGLPVRRHSGGGLDGFWIDRALQNEGIESHVVDPASIATSRRRRRAKTDGIDGEALVRALLAIAPRSPWQNGHTERLIGSIRRECLDHVVVFGEQHLRQLLGSYQRYYNDARTHLSLNKDAPASRAVQAAGRITAVPHLGGLHHQYVRI